jgi:hypothetical protein
VNTQREFAPRTLYSALTITRRPRSLLTQTMTMSLSQLPLTSLSVDTKKFIHLGYGHDGGGFLGLKKFRAVFRRKF